MDKIFLNLLKFLTKGSIPSKVLQKSYDHKIEDNKLKFKAKLPIKSKDFKCYYGSCDNG